ncbi:MAG: helix-turn-helix domain-containing protein [Psychrobacillus psychrodurans]
MANYYLFEDEKLNVNLVFEEVDIAMFINYWNEGLSIKKIAECLRRKPLEIALLVMDRAELGEIKQRPRGIFGKVEGTNWEL